VTDSAWWPLFGSYRLRQAVRADLPAIRDLLLADEHVSNRDVYSDMAPYEQAFEAIDADAANLLLVAVAEDGAVVGTFQITYIPGLAKGAALRSQIEAVRIDPAHRGLGLGTSMMNWAIDQAQDHGCAIVQLTSDNQRQGAHRFYTRLGFIDSHAGFKLELSP
jgi:GNAT superfamily N-acetyltransferase